MEALLKTTFLGLPVSQWLTAAAVAAGGLILALLVRWIAAGVIRRREAPEGESAGVLFALRMVQNFVFPVLVIGGLYLGVNVLAIEGEFGRFVSAAFVVIFTFAVIRFLVAIANELFGKAAVQTERFDLSRIRPLRSISIFLIWTAGLLFLLANLGFDITAVVAGLGIGGIAIALAAQAMLGDMFGYFVIILDKPFEIGDFLIFGDILGSVERIGVKTTRLRSLGGEQIIVSNSDLTNSRVRNYKRMEKRRIVFKVGVVYGTPFEKVKEIPSLLRAAVEREELAIFDRAHFASYGDWSLVFEVVYNVASPDYNLYMDIQERINLAIYESFTERDIEFAFPTQTVHLEQASAT
ncbi:MAG: mechanosensitive ion channel family protein [Spirochaetota bacterium]